jgi:hypothetical protein
VVAAYAVYKLQSELLDQFRINACAGSVHAVPGANSFVQNRRIERGPGSRLVAALHGGYHSKSGYDAALR